MCLKCSVTCVINMLTTINKLYGSSIFLTIFYRIVHKTSLRASSILRTWKIHYQRYEFYYHVLSKKLSRVNFSSGLFTFSVITHPIMIKWKIDHLRSQIRDTYGTRASAKLKGKKGRASERDRDYREEWKRKSETASTKTLRAAAALPASFIVLSKGGFSLPIFWFSTVPFLIPETSLFLFSSSCRSLSFACGINTSR